jgi:hypothetical protein
LDEDRPTMNSLEWLQFDSLSRQITDLENHMRAARSWGKHELISRLEQHLGQTENHRERLLEAVPKASASSGLANVRLAYRIG